MISAINVATCLLLTLISHMATGTLGDPVELCGDRNFTEPYNIPDSEECDKFYICSPNTTESSNETLKISFCAPGFHFSIQEQKCEDYKKVNCSGRDFDPKPVIHSESCPLKNGKFLCKSGKQCVDSSHLCDGNFDCLDGSDEFVNCASVCKSKGCAHLCVPTPPLNVGDHISAGTCLCRQGYTTSPRDPFKCVDVDECLNYNTCSQVCRNTDGLFQCSCIEGFKVGDNDTRSCQPIDEEYKLIYATRTQVEYVSLKKLDHLGKYDLTTTRSGRPVAVTYDARMGYTYWTDASANAEKIYRKSVTGSRSAEIVADTGIALPEGIALDWITGNIYFADSNLSHIAVCGNTSNYCSVLVQEVLDQPRDIALHPNQGIMLWTDWGENPAIMRAGMDGSHPNPIVSTNIKWPNGITIDQGSGRIYWVDAGLDRIETSSLDGDDRHIIVSLKNFHPFGIDVFGDRIFWSDWTAFNIKSANKMVGSPYKVHVHEANVLMNGLAIYHEANQPIFRSNPCLEARCSHICTLSPIHTFHCMCPTGMVLDNDKRTCVEPNNIEKLVLGFKNTIKMMRFNSIGRDIFEAISFSELKSINALVYNPINNTIIISDSSHKKIYEYSINKKKLNVLIAHHLDNVRGMDIDIVGENLYWVDGGRQTVEVFSFRTSMRKVIMTGVENPYDILVVPQIGSLFLARLGRRGGKLYKMLLNGYSNTIFQRVGEKEPIALAYDKELGNVLWADKVNRGIESISSDGRSASVVITHQTGPPTDVVKHGNEIYWTDMFSQDLKFRSGGSQYVRSIQIGSFDPSSTDGNHTNFFPKMAIINKDISYMGDLRDSHECSWMNPNRKNCSHICLIDGEGFNGVCVCPEGLTLDEDGITCRFVSTCSQHQFTCKDGHCINLDYVCDGVPDCSDHDDEVNCQSTKCPEGHFQCEANGMCVSNHWVCDGEDDCPNGADEGNCTFLPCNEALDFRCESSGRCIPKTWQCDHAMDCPGDDSDERGCTFTCPSGFFKCTTSQNCIVLDWVCDGDNDCEDGSDELQNCSVVTCNENQFTCNSGACIDIARHCDGSADCGNNEDEDHCGDAGPSPTADDPSQRAVDGSNVSTVPVVQLDHGGGSGHTVVIVFGVLFILLVLFVILGIILHKRNIQPKILVRPYVQQWSRYVNEPARRLFTSDGRRQQKLDCEMNEYDEVYAGGSVTYNNVYEEVDGDAVYDPNTVNGVDNIHSRSLADSGILASERESLFEDSEDCGNHYVSYNQKDKLLAD